MFAKRKTAASIESCVAPFVVVACVVEPGSDVRRWFVPSNTPWVDDVNPVAVSPGEVAALPIEVGVVSVAHQDLFDRKPLVMTNGTIRLIVAHSESPHSDIQSKESSGLCCDRV